MQEFEFGWSTPDGVEIFARQWHADDAPPRAVVALIHGLGEHSGRYQHVADFLTRNGVAVLAHDQRGHGRTNGIRGHVPSLDHAMDDVQKLLDVAAQRYPGLPVFLYGHSMGGLFVLYFALQRRPRLAGTIVTSPGLVKYEPVPPVKMAAGNLLYRLAPMLTMANDLDVNNLSHDPKVIQQYKADPLVHDRVSARLGLDIIKTGPWIIEHAPEYPLPLLLLQGSADRLISPAATQKFASRAPADKVTFRMVNGGYHELHNEPDKIVTLQAMLDWMNTLMNV